jgi:UDP-N-acetylglucosamine diphosphorylase / glucose-1-phosphate thymidylyltransferase / UDP-N-acetylgalactosamine diphosphorylase / glucosamine-1-phosphate N-acetyltransferase / galactosamine-1-phosphate N-acetyltransferase
MKAILPVAGNGTRMYPLGVTTPKCLLPILNKPQLVWSLEALQQGGIDEVILVISAGKFGKEIRQFAEQLDIPNLKIQFAVQEQQLGTAHVVQMAKDFFAPGEEFYFTYGDDLYGPKNIAQIVKYDGLAVTGMKVSDPEKWGIFEADQDGYLINVVEKPKEFVGDLANIGCMKLNTRIFEIFDQIKVSPRGEYEITDSLLLLAKETKIKVFSTVDYWIPVGYPWHILEATEYFMPKIESKIEGVVEENVVIKGKVILPKTSIIKSGSYIEGNVMIGEHTIIGPDAYLRDNVVIGSACKVGFGVEVKNSVIGNGSQVPHLSNIGDSILGNNVNFSGGSIVANWRHDGKTIQTPIKGKMTDTKREKFGTVIGDNVRLGINTTIYPGRKIWPGKTTLPGTIVDRDLID